jgi:hypothetical protein
MGCSTLNTSDVPDVVEGKIIEGKIISSRTPSPFPPIRGGR